MVDETKTVLLSGKINSVYFPVKGQEPAEKCW